MTEVRDNPAAHRYEIVVDGRVAGFAAYRLTDDAVVFTHTEVEPEHQGKGVAAALAAGALDAVRGRGLLVRPQCPYLARFIQRHPGYADLVAR